MQEFNRLTDIQVIWRICLIFFFVCLLFKCLMVMFNFLLRCTDLISSAWLNGLAGLLFGRHNYHLDMLKIVDSKETKCYCWKLLNSIIKTNSNVQWMREKSMDLNVKKKIYVKCMLQIVDAQSEMWMLPLWILNDSSRISIYNDTTT